MSAIKELREAADDAKRRYISGAGTFAEVAAAQQAVGDAVQAERSRPTTLAEAIDRRFSASGAAR